MSGLVRLARPLNCAMSAIGVAIGAIVGVGSAAWLEFAWPLALACAAAAAFTAGGNALNDVYDRETDKVNHPDRPLAAGTLRLETAKAFVAVAFAVAAVLAAFVNVAAVGLVLANAALMFAYEASLKRRGAPGNLVISYLVGSLFLFGGIAVSGTSLDAIVRAGALATLAFLATAGREVVKDIEDLRGDVDRRTLPHRIGVARAGVVAGIALLAAVVLSILPVAFRILSLGYAVLVVAADGMFIYAAFHSAANPSRAQRVTKYGMVVALAAFLAGAFP